MNNNTRIILATLFMLAATVSSHAQPERTYMLAGHRGASAHAPENTAASVRKALDSGVDRIEIDVQLTGDGALILMHDRTLNRTTSGKGKVKAHSLEQIRKLDAGSWFGPEYAGEPVPTLAEIIQLIGGRCELLIEVKEDSRYSPGIEAKVIHTIREHQAEAWCFVISFRHKVLAYCHAHDSSIRLQKLYVGKLPLLPVYISHGLTLRGPAQYPYAEEINLNKAFASRCMIKKIKRLQKKVNVWTEDNPQHARKLLQRGIDGFITNDPEKLARMLQP